MLSSGSANLRREQPNEQQRILEPELGHLRGSLDRGRYSVELLRTCQHHGYHRPGRCTVPIPVHNRVQSDRCGGDLRHVETHRPASALAPPGRGRPRTSSGSYAVSKSRCSRARRYILLVDLPIVSISNTRIWMSFEVFASEASNRGNFVSKYSKIEVSKLRIFNLRTSRDEPFKNELQHLLNNEVDASLGQSLFLLKNKRDRNSNLLIISVAFCPSLFQRY